MRGPHTRTRSTWLSTAALTLCAAAAQAGQGKATVKLKDAPGSELTSAYCAVCHSLEYIPANAPAMDRAGWQKTVQKMRERFGAPITDQEAQVILDYLSAAYAGKSSSLKSPRRRCRSPGSRRRRARA